MGEWYELKLPAECGVIWKHLRAYGEFFEIKCNELASILYLRRKIKAFILIFRWLPKEGRQRRVDHVLFHSHNAEELSPNQSFTNRTLDLALKLFMSKPPPLWEALE